MSIVWRFVQAGTVAGLLLLSPVSLSVPSHAQGASSLEIAPRCSAESEGVRTQGQGSMGSGHDCSGYPEEDCA